MSPLRHLSERRTGDEAAWPRAKTRSPRPRRRRFKLGSVKRRPWFPAAAQVAMAAHVLLLLPPPVQAATVPVPSESESGESALAALKVETAEPTVQEPVEPNKTVPDVEPPPQFPTFSPIPTDEELTKARVFGEPLIPEAGEANDAENQALAQAITTYLHGGDSEALEPLEGVVTAFPNSRWRVAVQANVGSWYRKKGYFTRAQRNLTEAWQLGKDSDTEGVRKLAEFAAGELMQIHMQFGQVDPLEALVTQFAGRELSGGITEKLYAARATVWGLRNDHENAIPSGSVALERLRKHTHDKKEKEKKDQDPEYKKKKFKRHPQLDAFPATVDGASLAEIQDLANLTDLKLQMVRRQDPATEIPVPSLVHLKEGHFATLVEERNGRIRLDDPLLGGEFWMSREAFEEEISGYFLIEQGPLPQGWRRVSRGETGTVRGKCLFAVIWDWATRQFDRCIRCKNSSSGMAQYNFHLGLANLSISDRPVGYSPPVGPSVGFLVTYNHRESTQPSTFQYSNLGARWTFDWLSYVEDDPSAVGEPVELYVRSGGREPYDGFVNGVSAPQADVRAVMTIVSTDPIKYEREMPDGSIEVYSQSDGATTAPRKVFMTAWKDPQGNQLTFTYDAQLRIVSATDAIGQVTTLSYELATDPLKITKVTDPFGRFATFDYDDVGRLIRITDVIGLTSEFQYNQGDFIRALTTPYGTTTFEQGTGPYNTATNQWVQATDPLGGTERVELLMNDAPNVPATDPANTVPTGFTGNSALNTHMSVYYTKLAMDRATTDPPDPTTGNITRWRAANTFKVSGYQIQSTKLPLEGRVWYEHVGETISNGTGPDGRPAMIGRVLDDGSSQIYRSEYNTRGATTRFVDPVGRETLFEFAPNGIDLQKARQKNGLAYDTLRAFVYNSQHSPTSATDAAGQTILYQYNAYGDLESLTTPQRAGVSEPRTTTVDYDVNGYVQSITAPTGDVVTSFTYDAFGRIATMSDSDGYTQEFGYDALDRPTRVTYPDSTFAEYRYNRLDAEARRDRLGRWRYYYHDAMRRVISTRDALGRVMTYRWCRCGVLDEFVDFNRNTRKWQRDLQGRVQKEIRPDGTQLTWTYETSTSRVKDKTNSRGHTIQYSYAVDDNVTKFEYENDLGVTPDVTFSYDPVYDRLISMSDGVGSTTFAYYSVEATPQFGAGQVSSIDGPFANDIIVYEYDELGRQRSRAVNGVESSQQFDALGRVKSEVNTLGTFVYEYAGPTSRLTDLYYPNGQRTHMEYDGSSNDLRLTEIHNKTANNQTLSRFLYTYDSAGRITHWSQQVDSDVPTLHEFLYDRVGQLSSAILSTDEPSPTLLKRYAYLYDEAGNRLTEQIDDDPRRAVFGVTNQLSTLEGGGTLRFAGTVSEASSVTVQGEDATVDSTQSFQGSAEVNEGLNTVTVDATDWSGNVRTNTYDVSVNTFTRTFTYDDDGNVLSDGQRTYAWDAESRLLSITDGNNETEFSYDGLDRRVKVVERENGVISSDTRFIWLGSGHYETRDGGTGNVLQRTFDEGFEDNGNAYYYSRDHLRSVREVTDSSSTLRARYSYGPFGRVTKVEGTEDSPETYTGHLYHHGTGLALAPARAYDAEIARWLSPDPIKFDGGTNFYNYVLNDPINLVDPTGFKCQPANATICQNACSAQGKVMRSCWEIPLTRGKILCRCKKKPPPSTGDCTPLRHATLQSCVNDACKGGRSRCTKSQDCGTLRQNMSRNMRCAAARNAINNICYKGGDPGHKTAAANAMRAAQICFAFMKANNCL